MRLSAVTDYFHKLDLIKSSSQLVSLLHQITSEGGIRGIFVARLPAPDDELEPNILLRGWNEKWIAHYARQNYVRDDPIAKELRKTNAPYVWSEVCRGRKLSSREEQIMREAHQAGLVDGVTVPILDVGFRTTCVSFTTNGMLIDREGREALRQIASISVDKLEKLGRSSLSKPKIPRLARPLAPREVLCLSLAGKGLSSREIARQLKLSFRTVDQYIENSMQKLNASNRTEAVSLATKYRFLD